LVKAAKHFNMHWYKYFFIITLGLLLGQGIFIGPIPVKASDTTMDLSVESITFSPTEPKVKDSVTVTIVIKNTGTANVTNSTSAKSIQYHVADFTVTNNVANSISRTPSSSSPLKPGETFTYTIKGSFTKSGSKTTFFMIDAGYLLEEYNENNNYKSQEIFVKPSEAEQNYMDLIAKSINVSPYWPLVGQKTTITIQGFCSNTSTLAVIGKPSYSFPGFTVENDVAKTVIPYPTENNPWTMLQNFEYNAFGYFTSEGSKLLSFTINPPSGYTDYNTNNNTVTTTVMVNPIFDLSAESMKVEQSTTTSSLVNLTANIKNKASAFTSVFSVKVLVNNSLVNTYSYSNGLIKNEVKTHKNTIPLTQFKIGSNEVKIELNEISGKEVNLANNILTTNFTVLAATSSAPLPNPPAVQPKPETKLETAPILPAESWLVQEKSLVSAVDQNLTNRLKGYILLQVQASGEAWYLEPLSGEKYYLKDGPTAFEILRKFGLGITNTDLNKIPVGIEKRFSDTDTDADGLSDTLEESLDTDPKNPDSDSDGYKDGIEIQNNYNPTKTGMMTIDTNLANRLKGKIVLQVQSLGQAWYINPQDGKRYYLKDGPAAYQIMKFLSLGISNNDLRKIAVGDF